MNYSTSITVADNSTVPIKVEWWENGGGALLDVSWSPTSGGSPTTRLSGSSLLPIGTATPLILDLNNDGVHTLIADKVVQYDLLGVGAPASVGWSSPEDGFLAFDINSDGFIRAEETHTFMRSLMGKLNKFALAPGSLSDIGVATPGGSAAVTGLKPSTVKKVVAKPVAKKAVKKVVKKTAPKKAAAKKPVAKKAVKKVAPKKAAAKKSVAKKTVKKAAPKKVVAKKPVAKKTVKKAAPKKVAAPVAAPTPVVAPTLFEAPATTETPNA
jgi:hypothetical protein